MTNSSLMPAMTRERVRHELAVRTMVVQHVRSVAPRVRRVTFDGSMDGFVSGGPGDHVKVFFPDPLTGQLHAPRRTPTGIERPPGVELVSRDYTPLVNADGALELDFVIHGDGGPASHWATRAQPGDTIVVAGPRGSHLPPIGAESAVIGGDETALPAISRWLDTLDPDMPVTVIIEVDDAADESYPLPAPGPNRSIHWLHRKATPGGTALLDAAVRALVAQDGQVFWWFAGESTSLVPVRRYLRGERGIAAANLDVSGYWKRGVINHDHHAPVDPDEPEAP